MPMKPCIAVCSPWGRDPAALFTKCLIDLLNALPRPYELFIRHERPVADARNELTAAALDVPQVTHLLFVDDDMTFPPDAPARLVAHDLPIVGGLCHNRRAPYHPVLAKHWPQGSGLEAGYGWIYDPPSAGLVDVDGTGGAFLLVAREVFEKIRVCQGSEANWAGWWSPILDISEDLSFCHRAKEAGFDLKVDAGLDIGHIGQVVVDRAFAERNRTVEFLRWSPFANVRLEEPVASIVIPTYDQKPDILRAAVESALKQTVPVEVIVVDDGSTSPPVAWADLLPEGVSFNEGDERLRLLRHAQNMGVAAALNTGIRAMRTRWFAWLSSDDLFDPRKVERQLGEMTAAKTLASFHRFQSFLDPEARTAGLSPMVAWRAQDEQRALLAQGCFINGSTVMIAKEVFDKVGLFDTSYRYAQDWELWNRIAQEFFWHPISEVLGTRREYGNLTAGIERDVAKANIMEEEQKRVMVKYAPRCPHCSREVVQPFALTPVST